MKRFPGWLTMLFAVVVVPLRMLGADAVTYSGTVTDAAGQPVAGAEVKFYQYPGQIGLVFPEAISEKTATTDAKGIFAFTGTNIGALVVVRPTGLAPTWKVWPPNVSDLSGSFTVSAPQPLEGMVVDEAGHPVSDAEVGVTLALLTSGNDIVPGDRDFLSGKPARELFSARTTSDGRFHITNFPPHCQAQLTAAVAGQALKRAPTGMGPMNQLATHSGQTDIKLELEPAGSIEGKVVEPGSGQAITGVGLRLQPTTYMGMVALEEPVTSGADGIFRISRVAPGDYDIVASFPGSPMQDWVADYVPVTVKAGEVARGLVVKASRGGVLEVTVRVKGQQQGLPHVSVAAYRENHQMSGLTDEHGVALLRVLPGQYAVYAMIDNMGRGQNNTSVTGGQTNQVQVELNPPSKISGVLHDAAGKPVANATAMVYPNFTGMGRETRSDTAGNYETTWERPDWAGAENQRYFLVARSPEQHLAAAQEIPEKAKTLDLEMKPAMTITAQINDPEGHPVPNVTGYIMMQMGDYGFSLAAREMHAHDSGHIVIHDLPAGGRYTLHVMAPGYGSANGLMQTVATTDHYDFPPLVLKHADRPLAGRVVDTTGKPVADAQVTIQNDPRENQPQGFTRTDASGHFTFEAVCEGPISLWANSKNVSGNAHGNGGDTNLVIRLSENVGYGDNTPTLTTTGTVYQVSGKPAAGIKLVVTPQMGMWRQTETDENGQYTMTWHAQRMGGRGRSRYMLVARDVEHNLAAAQEIEEKTTAVDLNLAPAFSVTSVVQDNAGKGIPGARVNLNLRVGNMGGLLDSRSVITDTDGHFTIAALPPGQHYSYYISAEGYGSASHEIKADEPQSGNLLIPPIKLKTADLELAGQVLDPAGKPFPGAQVMINGQGQPNANVRADSSGHFSFKVCDGPLTIFAYNPQGGGDTANVQSRGGETNVMVRMGDRPARFIGGRTWFDRLQEQPWTWRALRHWASEHDTLAVDLAMAQIALVAGTGAILVALARRKKT